MINNKLKNYIGNTYNRLTIIDIIKKYKRTYFLCKCLCGNLVESKMSHVKSGLIKSCGCYHKEAMKKRKGEISKLLKPDNYSAKYRLYKSYEKHARNRNLKFELSMKYFINLTKMNCNYCRKLPNSIVKTKQSRSKFIYNGVDRINNNLGYTINNVVTCCKHCNIAKNIMSYSEFKIWIKTVYDNLYKIKG